MEHNKTVERAIAIPRIYELASKSSLIDSLIDGEILHISPECGGAALIRDGKLKQICRASVLGYALRLPQVYCIKEGMYAYHLTARLDPIPVDPIISHNSLYHPATYDDAVALLAKGAIFHEIEGASYSGLYIDKKFIRLVPNRAGRLGSRLIHSRGFMFRRMRDISTGLRSGNCYGQHLLAIPGVVNETDIESFDFDEIWS